MDCARLLLTWDSVLRVLTEGQLSPSWCASLQKGNPVPISCHTTSLMVPSPWQPPVCILSLRLPLLRVSYTCVTHVVHGWPLPEHRVLCASGL